MLRVDNNSYEYDVFVVLTGYYGLGFYDIIRRAADSSAIVR